MVSLPLVWLPDSFQDKVSHLSIHLSLVFCHLWTPLGMTRRLEGMKFFYILISASSDKYVFANRAFLIGVCFVIEWCVQRSFLFLGVFWEEVWGEGIWKSVCKQVDSSLREGETEAAHLRFPSKCRGTMWAWNGDEVSLFPGALKMKHRWVKGMTEWGWVELSLGEGHKLAFGVLNGLFPPVATTLPTLGAQGRRPWAPCTAAWSCCEVAGWTNQPDLVTLNSV